MITETLITLCLFAINPVINKYMLKFISVKSLVLITGLSYIIVSTILTFLLYDKELQKDFNQLFENKGKYLWLIMLSFPLIHLITHYFYFSLIHDYKTYYVTALMATYPLLTAGFGYLFLKETITIKHIIGIILIITGVSFLTNGEHNQKI